MGKEKYMTSTRFKGQSRNANASDQGIPVDVKLNKLQMI